MLSVRKSNNETNNDMNITTDPAKYEALLSKGIDEFTITYPNFKIRIVSQILTTNDNHQ